MLSICIPVYNWDVRSLVKLLLEEIDQSGIPSEIIIIDDASNLKYRKINDELFGKVKYIQLDKNIGRSAIRNLFTSYAQFDHLLFLDCDAIIQEKKFLQNYLSASEIDKNKLIVGGLVYTNEVPDKNKRLRWKYGKIREEIQLEERKKNPYAHLKTINFLCPKSILLSNPFEEKLKTYGHEDTLWAYQLKKKNIPVIHIENPVLHAGLEENEVFLAKSEEGIQNLMKIDRILNDQNIEHEIKILKLADRIKNNYKGSITKFLFSVTKPFLKPMLVSGVASLKIFDFYRLGVLLTSLKKAS